MQRFAGILGLVVVASACSGTKSSEPVRTPDTEHQPERPSHRRSVVYSTHGMVAAEHPLAVQIGIDTLKRGGTAVDAAIAMNAALGFLQPNSNGMGGDLFAIVWSADEKKLYGLNASGRAPAALTIDKVKPLEDGTIDTRSPEAWSVPGCVDGWAQLHAKFGALPWRDLFAPAVTLARDGAPVPRVVAYYWGRAAGVMGEMPGFAETYLPGGKAPREGEVFRNPWLAHTLQLVADGGRDAYYRGPIAKTIVDFAAQHGGYFSLEDFANHKSEWVEPMSATYRGVEVFELPPNGQGIAALQMLNILENFDLRGMGRDSPQFWHTMIEAKKLAFEDRARFYADPAFETAPLERLLSKSYAKQRAELIDPSRASVRLEAGAAALRTGDTTFLAVADKHGNMVALIQSNYTGFGSGHAVAGFGLQNRGALFNLDADHLNALEPGKRPFHTIIPAFATKDGKPWLAFGLMGGAMQPQGHAQIIVNLVDFDMDLQQAGDAVRFRHSGSSQPTGLVMTDGGTVHLESGTPPHIVSELERLGHRIGKPGSFGGYQAVARDPVTGVWSGATESRKDGLASGY